MKHALFAVLLSTAALADTVTSVAVGTSATKMPSTTSTTRRSLLIENRDSASIYCSPSSDVTTSTGFEVQAGTWRAFPATVVWCVAAVAQSGSGSSRTLVWESDQ